MKNIKVDIKVKNDVGAPQRDLLPEQKFQIDENQINFDSNIFAYDQVFNPEDNQVYLYEKSCQPILEKCFEGFNGTIFVYGCSGSGKTYTMLGPDEAIKKFSSTEFIEEDSNLNEYPSNFGIIPRVSQDIFKRIESDKDRDDGGYKLKEVKAQYFEIYMEKIYDLNNYTGYGIGSDGIQTSKLGKTSVSISPTPIKSYSDVFKLLKVGQKNKKEASTSVNERSSRSHTIFALELVMKNSKGRIKRSKLNLIDLAGSEKFKNLGDSEHLHKESNNINKSLLHLSTCIIQLSENSRRHIPYRNSLLTKYLTDTLGGNSNTMIILTISKLKSNLTHTKSTLEFGKRAKKIKTKPVVQLEYSLPELKQIIKKLEKENSSLKSKITELLDKVKNPNSEDPESLNIPDFDDISQVQDARESLVESSHITGEEINRTLNEDLDELEKHLKDEIFDQSQLKEELEQCKEELKEAKDENLELNEEISTLQALLKNNEEKITELQGLVDEKTKEISVKEAEFTQLNKEKEQAISRMKELQDQALTLSEQLNNHEYQKEKLQSELEAVKSDLKSREESNVEITELVNEVKEEYGKLEETNKQLQAKLEETEASKASLIESLDQTMAELEKNKQNFEQLELQKESEQEELKTLIEDFEKEALDRENTVQTYEKEIELLKEQVSNVDTTEKDEFIEKLVETNKVDNEKLTKALGENKSLSTKLGNLSEEKEDLVKKNSDLSQRYSELEQNFSTKQEELTATLKESSKLKDEVEELSKQNSANAEILKEKSELITKLQQKNSDSTKKNSVKNNELALKDKEIEHLKEKVQIHEEYKTMNEDSFKALKSEMTRLQQENERMREAGRQLQEEYNHSNTQNSELKIKELKLQKVSLKFMDEIDELKKKLCVLGEEQSETQEELKATRQLNDEKDAEILKLTKEKKKYKKKWRKLKPKEENKQEENKEEEKENALASEANFIREYDEDGQTRYDIDMTGFLDADNEPSDPDEDDYTTEINETLEIEQSIADNSEMPQVFLDITNSATRERNPPEEEEKEDRRECRRRNEEGREVRSSGRNMRPREGALVQEGNDNLGDYRILKT